jgi:hypothetical protein
VGTRETGGLNPVEKEREAGRGLAAALRALPAGLSRPADLSVAPTGRSKRSEKYQESYIYAEG